MYYSVRYSIKNSNILLKYSFKEKEDGNSSFDLNY